MEFGHAGAAVVITGGASNIGRAIVHGFAQVGSRILICDVDEAQGQQVVEEAARLGAAQVELLAADLTEDGAGARVAATAADVLGGIDVLVNNAGWNAPGFLLDQTDRALWQRTIDINLFASIDCTQAAIPTMRSAGGGAVAFISSDAAFGVVRQGIYGASKAGLIALARTVAREEGRNGIRSNVVCPGLVLPEEDAVGTASLWAGGRDEIFDEDQTEWMRRQTPLRRLTSAADVAAAVVWITSPTAARQVTGQVIAVGGGTAMP